MQRGAGSQIGVPTLWRDLGRNKNRLISYDAPAGAAKSSTPEGYRLTDSQLHPPLKSGGLGTSAGGVAGVGALTAAAASGRNLTALLNGSGQLTAAGQLVVSASATLSGSGGIVNADARALLQAAATLTGSGSIVGTLRADAYLDADLSGVGTVAGTITAIGHLSASVVPFTELSPQNLATAVWNTLVATQELDGTMGYALRIAQAVLRNRVDTDPTTGQYIVYDDDGSVLVQGDLWVDTGGSAPYDGTAGAERRDRLT